MKKLYRFPLLLFFGLSTLFANATVHMVNVEDYVFSPATIAVTVGDTVMWMWVSGVHTTTSTNVPLDAAGWNQPIDASHLSFSYKVTAAGQYDYQCNYHYTMGMIGHISATSVLAVPQLASAPHFIVMGNIARDEIKIFYEVPSDSPVSIRLIDITGKVVRTFVTAAQDAVNTQSYSVADLPRGLYILTLQTDDAEMVHRVILQ